eukprot:1160971-Pelagomonas_calceolata.AAC.3
MALALRVRVFAFPEDLFSVWVMLAANTVCKVQMLLQYKLALAQSKQIDDFLEFLLHSFYRFLSFASYGLKIHLQIARVTGSTWLQDLAVRSSIVFNSMPSGNKLVGILNGMGMKFASKFTNE